MGFITADDGVKLHYEVLGGGERTILFVHGWFDKGASFAKISGELQKKCRIVVYDHRAHGQSEAPAEGYTITRLAQDMKNVIDELRLDTFIPIGYSMGTQVIWRYIELFGSSQMEKAVLGVMSPKLMTDKNYHLGLGGNCDAMATLNYLFMMNRSFEEYNLRDVRGDMPEERKAYAKARSDEIIAEHGHVHAQMLRLLIAMFEHDFWPVLDKIDVPTLVIAGENDIYPTATHEEVHRRIAGSKLCIIKNAGHMVMFEKPKEYVGELAAFIG